MSDRQALRDLQTRLAQRLQSARSQSEQTVSWLAVQAGGVNYLLPLGQAGEIFTPTTLLPVPYTRAWFLGVANLRGALCGVIDLAGFIHQDRLQGARPVLGAESRLVALNMNLGAHCALLIDRLVGLRSGSVFVSQTPPAQDAPAFFGPCYADAVQAQWQVLDLQALAEWPEFLDIRYRP